MLGKWKKGDTTIIGPGVFVDGHLRVTGNLVVEGKIEGNVKAEGFVSVGRDGVVEGQIDGNDVSVAGRVEGSVRADHFRLLDSGHVSGDVSYVTIEIARGGVLRGEMKSNEKRARGVEKVLGDLKEPATA